MVQANVTEKLDSTVLGSAVLGVGASLKGLLEQTTMLQLLGSCVDKR